jgi:hypothetical protein
MLTCGRFVEEDNLGVSEESDREREAALHASAVGPTLNIGGFFQSNVFQASLHFGGNASFGDRFQARWEPETVGKVGEGLVRLVT